MIKSFLISLSFSTLLFSAQQIIVVVADDFNATTAKLSCYEGSKRVCKDIDVNLGKNGLGWGEGIQKIPHPNSEPQKREGDKRAPAGIFALTQTFGYDYTPLADMPYLYADKNLICVDDSQSPFYNEIIEATGKEKSFESMRRKDDLYHFGITVAHNPNKIPNHGSCIFLHIQRGNKIPTVGCTSMKKEDLKRVLEWLQSKKEPLFIQIPKKYLPYVEQNFLKTK